MNSPIRRLKEIRETYPQLDVIVDLATTFGCPFEGKFPASRVVEFLKDYVDLGIREVCLCDTIGIANPGQVRDITAGRTAGLSAAGAAGAYP